MFSAAETSRFGNIPTPFYYYQLGVLKDTLETVTKGSKLYNYHIHYAFKANTNTEILELIRTSGLGADCVSSNEIKKAITCNYPSEQIVFAGVGKSDAEINIALDNTIFCFNCESIPELEVI